MKDKYELVIITGSIISFLLFSILLKASGISVDSIVNMQNHFMRLAIIQTTGLSVIQSTLFMISYVLNIFLALMLLTLGFAFLTVYGFFKGDNKEKNLKVGLASGAIGSIMLLFILGFSFISIFLAVALIICCIYIIPLANAYGNELKRWVFFRVGAHSINKVLLIVNVLLVLGIFFSVLFNINFYQESFKHGVTSLIKEMTIGSVSSPVGEVFESELNSTVENVPLIEAYMRWLPVLTAFGVWIVLEFLRGLVLSNIGGLFTSLMIRIEKKLALSR